MPREARFGEAARRLALQSAQYAGSPAGDAAAFAAAVEQAFQACLGRAGGQAPAGDVALTFRRAAGPLEVVIEGRVLSLSL